MSIINSTVICPGSFSKVIRTEFIKLDDSEQIVSLYFEGGSIDYYVKIDRPELENGKYEVDSVGQFTLIDSYKDDLMFTLPPDCDIDDNGKYIGNDPKFMEEEKSARGIDDVLHIIKEEQEIVKPKNEKTFDVKMPMTVQGEKVITAKDFNDLKEYCEYNREFVEHHDKLLNGVYDYLVYLSNELNEIREDNKFTTFEKFLFNRRKKN